MACTCQWWRTYAFTAVLKQIAQSVFSSNKTLNYPGADTEPFQFFPSLAVAQIPQGTLQEYADAWTPPRKHSAAGKRAKLCCEAVVLACEQLQPVEKRKRRGNLQIQRDLGDITTNVMFELKLFPFQTDTK